MRREELHFCLGKLSVDLNLNFKHVPDVTKPRYYMFFPKRFSEIAAYRSILVEISANFRPVFASDLHENHVHHQV
jgi:hypothetical protein